MQEYFIIRCNLLSRLLVRICVDPLDTCSGFGGLKNELDGGGAVSSVGSDKEVPSSGF
jgi:hypothetical protein